MNELVECSDGLKIQSKKCLKHNSPKEMDVKRCLSTRILTTIFNMNICCLEISVAHNRSKSASKPVSLYWANVIVPNKIKHEIDRRAANLAKQVRKSLDQLCDNVPMPIQRRQMALRECDPLEFESVQVTFDSDTNVYGLPCMRA